MRADSSTDTSSSSCQSLVFPSRSFMGDGGPDANRPPGSSCPGIGSAYMQLVPFLKSQLATEKDYVK